MLSGVPVSLWLENECSCQLKVIFSLNGEQPKEFVLPSTFILRTFDNEDIYLDDNNTAIRTDTSAERMAQIEKLNNIFFSTNYSALYQFKPFASPTIPPAIQPAAETAVPIFIQTERKQRTFTLEMITEFRQALT